ncbi:MAG: hypothetical protein GY739_19440, partial [Mesoflavibacter sp.]|nr:hypothetical protein [Mesoflavibacter sp.]
KVIRFDDEQGLYNDILFRDTSRLSFGSYNENTYDPYIHLNDLESQKIIELMKDIDLHGNINVKNNKRITGLQTPVGNSEPATKAYVDSHTGGNYLPLSGGTLTGDLTFGLEKKINIGNGNRITTLVNNDIVFYKGSGSTKFFAINENENYTSQRLNMNSNKIVNVSNGTDAGDAVNRAQLDTKLNLTGGTITGDLNLGGNNMFNINEVNLAGNNGRFVYFATGAGAGTNIQSAQANDTIYFSKHASIDKTLNINTSTKLCSFYGNIDMNNNRISNLNGGVAPADAVNRAQLDTKLNLTGGTMTGTLNFPNNGVINFGNTSVNNIVGGNDFTVIRGGADHYFAVNQLRIDSNVDYRLNNHKITELANGTAGTDAVNLNQLNGKLSLSGGTMSGALAMGNNKITNVATPTAGTDAVNKNYCDNNSGETIRYINITEKGFNPTGVGHGIICTFDPIPDGEYYFDINATVKHTQNNANADGFTFIINPSYVVSPDPV